MARIYPNKERTLAVYIHTLKKLRWWRFSFVRSLYYQLSQSRVTAISIIILLLACILATAITRHIRMLHTSLFRVVDDWWLYIVPIRKAKPSQKISIGGIKFKWEVPKILGNTQHRQKTGIAIVLKHMNTMYSSIYSDCFVTFPLWLRSKYSFLSLKESCLQMLLVHNQKLQSDRLPFINWTLAKRGLKLLSLFGWIGLF